MEESKLFNIVNHAYETVPFYRELVNHNINISTMNEFFELPTITKEMLLMNTDTTLSERYMHYPYHELLDIRRTSGSSGHYLRIFWDRNDNTKSLLELWINRRKYYDIKPNDKYCYFYTTDYVRNKLVQEKDITFSRDKKNIGFSKNALDEDKLLKIYETIYQFGPKYLLTQPSIAILLVDYIESKKLPIFNSLKYIELTGELLTESTRDKLERVFNCQICNQYGCNEANSIACEQGDKTLHVQESNVYVEIIKNGIVLPYGEYGDIHITSLNNYAMPFIRYNIGDQGRLMNKNNQLILELSNARVNDFVIDESGNKIPAYIFIRAIEHINEQIGNIVNQFQVIQNNINEFNVKLAIKPTYMGWKETVQKLFVSNIKQPSLEQVKWHFEITNHLFPTESTGKLAYYYNNMTKGGKY